MWTTSTGGRQTSLHLFEHVHGDSRDRGPALIDLMQTYEKAGLQFNADELPDHLPVVLEFASTQPPEVAKEFLAKWPTSSPRCSSALVARTAPTPALIAAVLEFGPAARAIGGADPRARNGRGLGGARSVWGLQHPGSVQA